MFATARSRIKAWIAAGAGSAAAIAVAGMMGAFGALHRPPAVLAPGQPIDTGQWLATPRRAYLSGEGAYGLPLKPGDRALVVEIELENRTAQSGKDYFDLLRPLTPIGEPDAKPFVVLTRDETMSPALQPGLPERMAYVWAMPDGSTPPKAVTLAIDGKVYKAQDNLYGTPGWFNRHELGTLTMPVGADATTPDLRP
ncbi:MAG: hypothetical protein J0I98_20755 [Mesorhizobium sp.]|nr:hypothetical protein [Mesorhizobium sp.]MBN9245214.1 hypothetical protein [Mesorhizobium sp.]